MTNRFSTLVRHGPFWIIVLILGGCGSREQKQQLESPGTIRLNILDAGAEEPSTINWETEAFHEQASQQLDRLATLLTRPGRMERGDVEPILDDSFVSSELRPSRLNAVYQDPAFLVLREVNREQRTDAAKRTFRGASGLLEVLEALVKPIREAKSLRAKFKVFRVSLAPDRAVTVAHFQLTGQARDEAIQQTAHWTCRWRLRQDLPPLLASIHVQEYEESIGHGRPGPLFADCTGSVFTGVDSFSQQLVYGADHWTGRVDKNLGMDAAGWEGLAVADVNGDDLEDIYVCQPGGLPNRLYLQQVDGTVADISRQAGVDWLDETQSALFVDLDNDGNQDLIVSTGSGLIFMRGDGSGAFSVKLTKLLPEAAAFSLCAADFDSDGDLDVFGCGYAVRRQRLPGTTFARPMPYHDANNGGRNVLFRNDRNWRFRDVTNSVGLDENNRRFSFAAAWEDYDNDGDLDLYVANDYGRNNLYRYDQPEGRFRDVAAEAGVEDISTGMSVSWGDYDNDGWMDLYVSNMWSSAGNRIAYQRRFHADADQKTRAEFQRHARGNSLFRNTGDGRFHDVSVQAGVTMGRWAWGALFADINNDGFEDLLVANGFITQEDTGDL